MAKRGDEKVRVIAVYRIMLRGGERMSASKIIRELEGVFGITCNRRTLYDDMRAIDRIVPIDAKGGHGGGFRLWDFREVYDD